MLKNFLKIMFSIILFLCFVTVLDSLTTYEAIVYINEVHESNGIITLRYDGTTGLGTNLKSINIVAEDVEKGIYKFEVLGSYLARDISIYNEYKIDNTDNHIKELRYYNPTKSLTYEVIYPFKNK